MLQIASRQQKPLENKDFEDKQNSLWWSSAKLFRASCQLLGLLLSGSLNRTDWYECSNDEKECSYQWSFKPRFLCRYSFFQTFLSSSGSSPYSHFPLSDSVVSQLCNHQRVRLPPPSVSSSCAKSSRHSHWDTLRRLTRQRFHQGGAFGVQSPAAVSQDVKDSSWCGVRRGSYPPAEPPCHAAARPYPPSRYKPMSSCPMSQCRVCYTNLLWEQSLNRSAPSVYSSVLIGKKTSAGFHHPSLRPLPPSLITATRGFWWINNVCFFVGDNIIEELDSGDDDEGGESADATSPLPAARRWAVSPPCLTVPYYSTVDDYLQPDLPRRLRSRSPRIRTAPPSPMRPHRVVDLPPVPPVELAKQESLDELRTTVQLAASSMENSTKDIKLLGEKMAAATERMSDTVQDNSQALVLLTQVVEQLQTLLATNRTDVSSPKPPAAEQDGTAKKSREQRPSLTHQSRCSFPSLPSSSSSSSLSSSQDAPSTSQGTSCLSVSIRGSPRTTAKSKGAPSPQKKPVHAELQASKHLLTNGLLEEEASHAAKGRRSNRRKKTRKKATWETVQKSGLLGSFEAISAERLTCKRTQR